MTVRKPNGFTWAKFFNGSEAKEVESIHRHMSSLYRLCPLAECHPKYVNVKGPNSTHGRVTDDCPALHTLSNKFADTLRKKGWEAAKVVYQKIKDFKRP